MPELRRPESIKPKPIILKPKEPLREKIKKLRLAIFKKTGKIISTATLLAILLAPKPFEKEITIAPQQHSEQYVEESLSESLPESPDYTDNLEIEDLIKYNTQIKPTNFPIHNTAKPESDFQIAVKKAANKLKLYLTERTKKNDAEIIFGPNFDYSYQWRTISNGDGVGRSQKVINHQKEIALKKGFPNLDLLSDEFRLLLNEINYVAREDGAQNNLIVIKHFPGGKEEIEHTERKEVMINLSLDDARKTILLPFEFAIMRGARGIMLSHAEYSFESELLKKYPELKQYYLQDRFHPASLSPAIIRGLLRNEFGYKGLIISDWYNMGATNSFLRNSNIPELNKLEKDTKTVILGTLAGINWITGLFINSSDLIARELRMYFNRNPKFESIFNQHIVESLFLGIKYSPLRFSKSKNHITNVISNLELDDFKHPNKLPLNKKMILTEFLDYCKKLKLREKVQILTRQSFGADNTLLLESNHMAADLWNRQGIITFYFMTQVVSYLSGLELPEPEKNKETEWALGVMKIPKFQEYYRKIDWNDPQIIAALTDFVNKL